jgi:hypothetical protein
MNIILKTSFTTETAKDIYYENILNILYGINNRHKISFIDNETKYKFIEELLEDKENLS